MATTTTHDDKAVHEGDIILSRASSDLARGSKNDEHQTPAEIFRKLPAGYSPDEPSENGTRDVNAHDPGNRRGRPLFRDVRDRDDEDSRREDPLEETPDGQRGQRRGGSG